MDQLQIISQKETSWVVCLTSSDLIDNQPKLMADFLLPVRFKVHWSRAFQSLEQHFSWSRISFSTQTTRKSDVVTTLDKTKNGKKERGAGLDEFGNRGQESKNPFVVWEPWSWRAFGCFCAAAAHRTACIRFGCLPYSMYLLSESSASPSLSGGSTSWKMMHSGQLAHVPLQSRFLRCGLPGLK